jgi:hypothetical protein
MSKLDSIAAATATPVHAAISPTLHPDQILPLGQTLATDDSPATAAAFQAGRTALKSLYETLADMESAITATEAKFGTGQIGSSGRLGPGHMVDGATIRQVLPDEVSARLAADMGDRFARCARAFDANMKQVDDTIASLSTSIDRALTPKTRDAMAAQSAADIRRFVAALPDEKRAQWVLDAIEKDGDLEVAQALLSTSGFVSGLDRPQTAFVRESAAKRFSPKEFAHLESAKKLADHLRHASALFVEHYKKRLPAVKVSPHVAAVKKLKEA